MKSNIEGITEQNHLRLKNPIKRKRHPDEIKDRENYRRMKGIPVPNYNINKGILAENMATAAIEYPFCTGREYGRKCKYGKSTGTGTVKNTGNIPDMAGRAEELQWRRLVEGTGDKYNYSVIK